MSKAQNALIDFGTRHVRILSILALVLPLVFFGYTIVTNAAQRETAQAWRIEIGGYDPRDLLKGRYIQYRYQWNNIGGNDCKGFEGDCCYCLRDEKGDRINPTAEIVKCNAAYSLKRCDALIQGEWKNGTLDIGQTRYMVDERVASDLDRLLRGRQVKTAVEILLPHRFDGKAPVTHAPQLGEIYFNGMSLSEMRENGVFEKGLPDDAE